MTGQDLINYIEDGKLQDKHFFIDVEGYLSPIQEINENEIGDIILSQEDRCSEDWKSDPFNLERYFSEWFDIISYDDAKNRWENGERNFLVLLNDGSDRYADNYETWEELTNTNPDAYFGIEK